MRHSLRLDGHAYALRPVAEADARFIVELRRQAGRFLNRGAEDDATQLAWLARYFERAGDYYFVIESRGEHRAEGLIALYDVDAEESAGEWGRWIVAPGSPSAIESALLIYRCAFDVLNLDRVYCRTLADNAQVVAFHDSCGLTRLAVAVEIVHDGAMRPAVQHELRRNEWPAIAARLDLLARRIGARRVDVARSA